MYAKQCVSTCFHVLVFMYLLCFSLCKHPCILSCLNVVFFSLPLSLLEPSLSESVLLGFNFKVSYTILYSIDYMLIDVVDYGQCRKTGVSFEDNVTSGLPAQDSSKYLHVNSKDSMLNNWDSEICTDLLNL